MKNYPNATGELCDFFEDMIVDGNFRFEESSFLATILLSANLIKTAPIESKHVSTASGKMLRGYVIHPIAMRILVALAETDNSCFDCCAEICSFNIIANVDLPLELRGFASRVLYGDLTRPSKSSRPIKKNWLELSTVYLATLMARDTFDLFLTRNDEGHNKYSACDAVAEALTICGRETKYSEIKYLAVHPDKKKLREQVQVMLKLNKRLEKISASDIALNTDETILAQQETLGAVLDIMNAYFTDAQINALDT